MLKHLDLFSGIGGFALAAKWAGFRTIGFSEIDKFCNKVLEKNFPGVKNYGDIKQITELPENIDLMTGGFPCQPFSQNGKKRGKYDDRYLWPEFLRIIQIGRPDWIVIENVSGAVGMVLTDISSELEFAGYQNEAIILPACASNAPHRRDRLWIIAQRNSIRGDTRLNIPKRFTNCDDILRYTKKEDEKWQNLQPEPWKTYTAQDWFDYNTRAVRSHDGLPGKLDKPRIKALGNAIVPQVVYPILRTIYLLEQKDEPSP